VELCSHSDSGLAKPEKCLNKLNKHRSLVALLLAIFLHLLLSSSFHLSPDEAHYALYASHIDWSYYDHPPLVGWLQWPFLKLGGSDLLMRCLPMLAWCMTAWLLKLLTLELYPAIKKDGFWGVRWEWWLLGLGLLPHLMGIALLPDTLLMPLTIAVMWVTWRLCQTDQSHRLALWAALGLLLGLSGLAKYTAILLALGAALSITHAQGLKVLTEIGAWLSILVASVCVIPVFYWNYLHDWASFAYQLNHAAGQAHWQVAHAVRYILVIWLAFGLTLPLVWMVALREPQHDVQPRGDFKGISANRVSLFFGLPGLLLWIYLSGRGSTLPHWATPSVLAMLPLGAWGCYCLATKRAKWLKGLLALQGLICLVFFGLMLAGGISCQKSNDQPCPNPFADLYGWREAAEMAHDLADQNNATALAVTNWSLASRLAWYARPIPVKLVHARADQFDLWFGNLEPSDRVIWVDWSLMHFEAPVGAHQFKRCDFLAEMPVSHWQHQIAKFRFWSCHEWRIDQADEK
jgi:4-amino-4-deoxy-L-arabinose transferase-like glycosyltransferase